MENTKSQRKKPIPVILDTDIGDDIDDTWALAMLLKSPELDVKLIITAVSDTPCRAKMVAKLLEAAGRTDIPIGIGLQLPGPLGAQAPWVADYDMSRYPGTVHDDGVGAIIDTIMTSPEPVTLIGIGPLPNIGQALEREPRIANNARFVGMHGSVRGGYGSSKTIAAEYNVKIYTPACQKTFTAAWDMTITPLDTCGKIVLSGEKYMKVRESKDPLLAATIDAYRVWAKHVNWTHSDAEQRSTVLFDTVAVYLAFCDDLLVMEELTIRVTNDAYTIIDPDGGKKMRCAMAWKDLPAFEDLLVERLLS